MHEPVIKLDRLTKCYGDFCAVRDLTLTVLRGAIFGFLGANGAGKTTTIRMLCGLVRPSGGHAMLAGREVWRDRHAAREKFGYVAQRFSLYRDLTVDENMRFFAGASRVPRGQVDGRITRLLKLVDLEAKRGSLAGDLSGGTRQLLAIACALIHEPPLLFLDEPTSGLDPVHRQQMWNLLYDLSNTGITIFITTHYMDEAERCTEVGFIDQGRLLAQATPRAFISSFNTKLLELDVDPVMPGLVRLREEADVLGVSMRSGRLRIYAAEPAKLVARWREKWPFPNLQWKGEAWVEPDMEDVFTAYSQGYNAVLKPLPK